MGAAVGVLRQSPVLVGRDPFVRLAGRRLAEAAAGNGQLLFVAGEAGIGKTRLLGEITGRARREGFEVFRAAAFPGDTESSGGLLLDLASDLRRAGGDRFGPAGQALGARLRAPRSDEADPHRQRRLLVQDLTDIALGMDGPTPVLVILEDLHWADPLSLEVVGHVAGRLARCPVLVVGAYRSDELLAQLPMRQVRSRLVAQRLAEEIRLPRLTVAETAAFTSAALGHDAPAAVVSAIHDRSDGIPLHIEEFLAGLDPRTVSDSDVRSVAVPGTLGDAVLARAAGLDPEAREVAAAAAVIGRSFDFDLLATILGADPESVGSGLRQLEDSHFVVPGVDSVTFDFCHALIRDALYTDTALPARRRLHARVAEVAHARGYREAFVSAHFERAGQAGPAYQHAVAAAREASRMSAHREALELYRRAERNLPAHLDLVEQAELFAALGDEAAASDDNQAAARAYQQAYDHWTAAGYGVQAAALVSRLVVVGHLLGEGLDSRIARLRAAVETVSTHPAAQQHEAKLLSEMAAAYMLDRRLEEGITYGERAHALSQQLGDERTALNTAATVGSVLVFAGRMTAGWTLLQDTVERAESRKEEAEAARGYRMLGTSASVLVEYDRAETWLNRGIDFAESVELWNHRHYMAAHLAHVQWATGDWSTARRTAERALADGRGGATTRITAQYILGYLAFGRADYAVATELLSAALREGERMRELQRYSPPLWGLAETALLQGEAARAVELCERAYPGSLEVGDAAYLFPFLLTGVRAYLAADDRPAAGHWYERLEKALRARSIPGSLPALEHGRGLLELADGDLTAAAGSLERVGAAWSERRRFWEGGWALLDRAALAQKARRRAEAARLITSLGELAAPVGAQALLAAGQSLAAACGSTGSGRTEPWYPLTAREFEIAQLVARGLTNRQIAAELVLAPKTISSHIEHILTKLGAARRAEIAAWSSSIVDLLPPK